MFKSADTLLVANGTSIIQHELYVYEFVNVTHYLARQSLSVADDIFFVCEGPP